MGENCHQLNGSFRATLDFKQIESRNDILSYNLQVATLEAEPTKITRLFTTS